MAVEAGFRHLRTPLPFIPHSSVDLGLRWGAGVPSGNGQPKVIVAGTGRLAPSARYSPFMPGPFSESADRLPVIVCAAPAERARQQVTHVCVSQRGLLCLIWLGACVQFGGLL